jgi:hypothetical protein
MISSKTESSLRWNVIALALAGPALLATFIWIIWYLRPATWCGALIGAAKEAQIPPPQCSQILLTLLAIHRDAIWILGSTLGIVIVAIGLAATGMSFKGRIAGNDLSMGADAGTGAPGADDATKGTGS